MKVLRVLFIIILIIAILGATGYGIYQFSILYKENKFNEDYQKIASEYLDDDYNVDFDSLREINRDVIGYLIVTNTKINYPVVKGKDNTFYIDHSLDKSLNNEGWIFANVNNTFDGYDINIAIFGNENIFGSMFSSLKDTLTSKWQSNSNHQIILVTEDEISNYEVFSTYKMPKEDYYIKNTFPNNDEYQEFLNLLKERSNHDYGVEVTTEDQILTLATINKKEQYVLHAKKIIENN